MILFLEPYFEVKPWAGDELAKIYDCPNSCGEAWIVSGYNKKSSVIKNGIYKGQSLRHLWQTHKELFGNDYPDKEFPLLIKLISSKDNLSVQVHPNDDYALATKNSLGKFECWYILPETKAKHCILGVNVKNAVELKAVLEKGMIEEYLIKRPIKAHDLVIVEPGRCHAIMKDTFCLEIQESSDITYRLYDYNREPRRELHIADSLNVIDYNNSKSFVHPFQNDDDFNNPYFDMKKIHIKESFDYQNKGFVIFYVVDGKGFVNDKTLNKGDCFLVTKDTDVLSFSGSLEVIAIFAKPKSKERLRMRKTALITGIAGQEGYYLTKLLLEKNYEVHGLIQSRVQLLTSPIACFASDKEIYNEKFFTHIGDLTDTSNLNRILESIKPDEVYHLASQSHVDLSFDMPEYTTQVNSLGTLRLLDAIKASEIRTKLFNLSSPYLFSGETYPQDENTIFDPKSPYAVSKVYAHYMVKSYRENYSIYAVNGICYNHESKYRSDSFVSKKIVDFVKNLKSNPDAVLHLGNLNASREWGLTKEYAYAMWLMLQNEIPTDYVVSTGKAYTIREFVIHAFAHAGINLAFKGEGLEEVGYDVKTGKVYVDIDAKLLRPNDAKVLVGNPAKFYQATGFKLNDNLDALIDEMMEDKSC